MLGTSVAHSRAKDWSTDIAKEKFKKGYECNGAKLLPKVPVMQYNTIQASNGKEKVCADYNALDSIAPIVGAKFKRAAA